MTSHRVTNPDLSLNVYDVVGSDSEEEFFICHVGLAANADSQQAVKILVVEMKPPLSGRNNPGEILASVVGSTNLTDDQARKIQNFIDRHANEHLALQQFSGIQLLRVVHKIYCILPHTSRYEENDGRCVRMRFSCVGFVFEAYKKAGITLLSLDSLPMVDRELIKLAYPDHVNLMERGIISPEALGLEGEGPWQVMLCGYLFHALNRTDNVIRDQPYSPSLADRKFA